MAAAIFATCIKAFFIIAIPVTLIVYVCIFVGSSAEHFDEKK